MCILIGDEKRKRKINFRCSNAQKLKLGRFSVKDEPTDIQFMSRAK